MNIANSSASVVEIKIGEHTLMARRLSVRDLGALQQSMPLPDEKRAVQTLGDITRWCRSPVGACQAVAISLGKTMEQVEQLGPVIDIVTAATEIIIASVTSGEEGGPAPTPKEVVTVTVTGT